MFANAGRACLAVLSCAAAATVTGSGLQSALCMPYTGAGPGHVNDLPKRKKAVDKRKLECAPLLMALFSCYKVIPPLVLSSFPFISFQFSSSFHFILFVSF